MEIRGNEFSHVVPNAETQSRRALTKLETRFVGVSAEVRHVRELVARVSSSDATVLIQGESAQEKLSRN